VRGAAFAASGSGRLELALESAFEDPDRRVGDLLLEAVVARADGGRPFDADELELLKTWCGVVEGRSPAFSGVASEPIPFAEPRSRRRWRRLADRKFGRIFPRVSRLPSPPFFPITKSSLCRRGSTLRPSRPQRPTARGLEALLDHDVDDIRNARRARRWRSPE
jgi:hypothetical protein